MSIQLFKVPQPLWGLMQSCEVFCVAVCCHHEAFDLNAEHLRRWAEAVGEAEFAFAQRQLKHLMRKVALIEGEFEYREIFWFSDKETLLAWLRQWEEIINEAARA